MSILFSSNTPYDIRRLNRRQNAKYFFCVLYGIYEMPCGIERVKSAYDIVWLEMGKLAPVSVGPGLGLTPKFVSERDRDL